MFGCQDDDPNYKPPPERSIDDILETDKEDASLQQYKATLLGKKNYLISLESLK